MAQRRASAKKPVPSPAMESAPAAGNLLPDDHPYPATLLPPRKATGNSPRASLFTSGGNILAFVVGDQRYGLPVGSVRQIIEMVAITPLPGAPEVVPGVINFHGQVIPLIDMRLRFLQPPQPYTLRTPIIITQLGDRLAGLVVDTVTGVMELSPQQLQDPMQILPRELSPQPLYLAAVAPLPDGLLPILDPGAILPQREKRALSRAMSQQGEKG